MNGFNNFINAHQNIVAVIVVISILCFIKISKLNLKNKKFIVAMAISLLLYVIFIFSKFVFCRSEIFQSPNLDFLWSYRAMLKGENGMFSQIFLNIMAFIPIGCFANECLCGKRKNMRMLSSVIFGFFVTLSVESLQFFLHKGMFELDDIFNNTIGILIGVVITLFI